jgi:MFS transporter, YNFM family, putative membrane transport protein
MAFIFRMQPLSMDVAPLNSVSSVEASVSSRSGGLVACMLTGMCTFLNVYCTQPLLPYFQRLYNASEIEVSLTVSATILAVAIAAPFVGMMAESIGRKKVIVPCLYGLTVPTMLAATSRSLHELIFWRFIQGLFIPGVIVVIMAYIGEEFQVTHVGRAMAAYVSGTVLGGFGGRYISGVIAQHFRWGDAFIAIGIINFAGAILVQRELPRAKHFVRSTNWRKSIADAGQHLRNPHLVAVFGMGFVVLFSLVGAFTYANFHLALPPYRLNSQQLGSIFFVYLLGAIITPFSGRFLDRFGMRLTAVVATCFSVTGLLLTLSRPLAVIAAGLAIFSSGVFIFQAVGTVQTGVVAGRARSSAAGLYVTFYYIGGSLGAIMTGWAWQAGGWPACVYLLMGVACLALALAFASRWNAAPVLGRQ